MRQRIILFTTLTALVQGGLTAQQTRGAYWRPPAATAVKAALAAPSATIAEASPIALELTVTTTGPWKGNPGAVWERRQEDGSWVPFVDKGPRDPSELEIPAATTIYCRPPVRPGVLFHLTPGTWRVQYHLWWLANDHEQYSATTPWCEITIQAHAANQRAMQDTRMLGNPWQFVAGGSRLGEDLVIPPALQGGMVPKGTPMADLAAAITAMRNSGVSIELATAADLTLLRRDARRVGLMAAGQPRTDAAAAVRTRLEALAKAVPAAATPLAGQHGEVLEVQVALLQSEDPAQAAQLIAKVRATSPMLADRLAGIR